MLRLPSSCLASCTALLALLAGCSQSSGTRAGSGGSSAGGSSSGGSAQSGGVTATSGGASGSTSLGGSASGGVATSGGTSSGGAATGGAAGSSLGGTNVGGSAGSGGAAGAAGGAGGSGGAALTLTMPIVRNGHYVLEFGDVLFEVDPSVGARVITFSLAGKNLLTSAADDKTNGGNYGSTFWPSPQNNWGTSSWPPIPEVDNQAFTPSLDGTSIVMTQPTTSVRSKVSVVKRFTAVLNAQAVDVQYTLTNKDTAAVSWAPWEVSRVALSGITFFPSGSSVVNLTSNNLPTSRVSMSGGVTWYQNQPCVGYTNNACSSGDIGKYSADGSEGWLAQVSGNLLFVKRYADVAAGQAAPGEGDSEFYAGAGYEEIEPQGAYQLLQPGASLTWTVRWYVRQLSDTSIATVGSAALVALARSTIQQ